MDSRVLLPREASRLVAETSKDVKVKQDGVLKVAKVMAEAIKTGQYNAKSWKEHELNPSTMDKAALEWIFVADTLNFSFWSADETKKFAVTYKGQRYTGYWSLCAAMNRAVDEGIPLTDPNYFATVTKEELQTIFRSDTEYEIPLIDERLGVLHNAGQTLLTKYDGSFVNVVTKCEKSAQKLLQLVVDDFPSYRDETDYNGKHIAFYKRAQILIGDIWACFEGQGYGEFEDIDTITMFADYRIPQALVFFGAMEYSEELMAYLRKDNMMNTGDRYEVEIRGGSIWVTELITTEAKRILATDQNTKDLTINSIIIDHYLWDYRRDHAEEMDVPFHRIRCIYY